MQTAVSIARACQEIVCESCTVADSPLPRMRGLLGRSDLPAGEGLLLRPANAIHTFFMRFPIDVVFLDGDMRVLAVNPGLAPWRTARFKGTRAVLELAAGESRRHSLRPGDRLEVVRVA